jgi:hypothetical protein
MHHGSPFLTFFSLYFPKISEAYIADLQKRKGDEEEFTGRRHGGKLP